MSRLLPAHFYFLTFLIIAITIPAIIIKIGTPKACRAVGMANHNNPILIIVPCHRVINENKKLGGYALGLDLKRRLLELEKENS